MGDFAEEIGVGRKEPGTVFNPEKQKQVSPWTTIQNGMVQASFLACYGMLGLALFFEPKDQR